MLGSFILILFRCSNQAAPTGGPKDEDPPIVIHTIPLNGSTNYDGDFASLEFNEFVELNSPQQEILIMPSVGKDVTYKIKRKSLFIIPKNGWDDSVTYSIAVRSGVRDITEQNTPKNVRLAFSTGPVIDSMEIKGRVKLMTEASFSKEKVFTIGIYRADTFDIFTDSPVYFTWTFDNGRFSLQNLKEYDYYIYAFEDNNKNLTVESKSEYFGFRAQPIPMNFSDSIELNLIYLDSRKLKINRIRNNGLSTTITCNKSIASYTVHHLYEAKLIHSFGSSWSEIVMYNFENIVDSVAINLHITDSLQSSIDTIFYIKNVPLQKSFSKNKFSVKADLPRLLSNPNRLEMSFKASKPIQNIHFDSIFIRVDSVTILSFDEKDFSYDSTHKTLNLYKLINKEFLYGTPPEDKKIKTGSGFIMSIEKDSSHTKEYNIPYIKDDETGSMLIEIVSKEPHYIIELINEKGTLIKQIRNTPSYSFKGLTPQKYKIKVIVDDNNNGVWDVGNFYERKEPEKIYFYKNTEGEYLMPIRSGWELGPLQLVF